ncbi:MAG: UDP-N-acetylmuramoyl-L-alanine--D-glutamate ligase [Candidatus Sericytochromatia bacterium]
MSFVLPDLTQAGPVVVLGAARSGLAAAFFLQRQGFQITVSDARPIADETQAELRAAGIGIESGGHQESTLAAARYLIASPGIPVTAPPYRMAAVHGIPVVSEIEVAHQFNRSRLIAVTGSNGKSTTVSLLEAMLQKAGYRARAGGNLGTPLFSLIEQELDFIVLELSSFQLESTFSIKPEIALLLNLYENHLDRHGDMAHYYAAKKRLFTQQNAQDHAILNLHNPWCQQLAQEIQAQVHFFGDPPQTQLLASVHKDQIYLEEELLMPLEAVALPGHHNLENILAALTAAALLKLPRKSLRLTLEQFQGIPHRLERVGNWQGRAFINDSKSTNYLAAERALESLRQPIVLIAGGQDKGGDFSNLARIIGERVKSVVLLGESAQDFQHRLQESGYNQVTVVADMQTAVETACRLSAPGDAILLSPATASYDRYRNFEERGDDFRRHVAACTSQSPA